MAFNIKSSVIAIFRRHGAVLWHFVLKHIKRPAVGLPHVRQESVPRLNGTFCCPYSEILWYLPQRMGPCDSHCVSTLASSPPLYFWTLKTLMHGLLNCLLVRHIPPI